MNSISLLRKDDVIFAPPPAGSTMPQVPRRHDVTAIGRASLARENKDQTSISDVYITSGYRRCIDVETRRRHVVDMTSTTNSDVFTTSGHLRCLNVETRRL